MGYSEKKKRKNDGAEDPFWSKNNGKNIRYRKRLQHERESREAYEDGLRQVEDNIKDVMSNG